MKRTTRREFLKLSGLGLVGLTAGGIALRAHGKDLVKLKLDDPSAKALEYVNSSAVSGQNCANCLYIQGDAGATWRPCMAFPDKLVNANGWCKTWSKGV